jgi:hypothetical protein
VNRIVLPELLDVLPPQDASALRSRRDLRRVNAWMGHPQIMARTLQQYLPDQTGRQLVELGAGDGHFLLSVARRLNGCWPGTQAVLVDRLAALDPRAGDLFQGLGWQARGEIAEAAEWLRRIPAHSAPVIVSNLFFHQFDADPLTELLRLAADASSLVIALEPRRAWLPLFFGRWLWAIGCGPVTRHDARISTCAGFRQGELSALWPDHKNWRLVERPAGLFSHLFIAQRKE